MALASAGAAAENQALQADVAALAEAAAVLSGVLAASGDCIKVLSLDGRILFVNDSGRHILEMLEGESLHNLHWTSFWPNEPRAVSGLADACAGRDSRFVGSTPTLRGNNKQWDVRITPVRGAGDAVTQILVVSRDITDQQRLEVQKALLSDELEHRIKNMLTMVAAIAHQTLRAPATVEEASASFAERIQALARAQTILTRSSWESADLRAVVIDALEPFREAGCERRFTIQGPTVDLSAGRVLALVLAVHELAANAVKYGALSGADGHVSVVWSITSRDLLVFTWSEAGGPEVFPPERTGFGSRLIKQMLAAEFRGTVALDFAASGACCVLTAPLH
ncbi:sensor histidine kinase [Polymorphobacter multimanifer]|nr:PAS domain-containing sensor histidine kinase [Polymorphobacter multimanifer]